MEAPEFIVPGKPGCPSELLAMEMTDTALRLLVLPPDDDGGSPVTGYAVQVQRVPSRRWIQRGVVAPDPAPAFIGRLRRYHAVDVGGLDAHARYRVRLAAVNQAGYVGPPTTKCCHKPDAEERGTVKLLIEAPCFYWRSGFN